MLRGLCSRPCGDWKGSGRRKGPTAPELLADPDQKAEVRPALMAL